MGAQQEDNRSSCSTILGDSQGEKVRTHAFSRTFKALTVAVSSVPVTISGGPAGVEVKALPLHKKNAEIGEKQTVYSSTILLEQEDAASFEDREEVSPPDS